MFGDIDSAEEILEAEKNIVKCFCEECQTKFYVLVGENNDKCCFCQSTKIKKTEYALINYPMVIPFNKTGVDALKEYKRKIRRNPFVPLTFRKKKNICGIKRIYLPAVLSSVLVDGNISVLAGDKTPVKKDGTKYIETKKYQVLETVHIDYQNLLFPTYAKINEKLLHTICNYDYRFITDYNESLIDDTSVIIGNIEVTDIADKAREAISNHTLRLAKENINHSLLKTEENNIKVQFHEAKEILVPVFLLNIKHKDKDYLYLMNGQSGKAILESAFSLFSIVVFGLLVFCLFFVITTIIAYLL